MLITYPYNLYIILLPKPFGRPGLCYYQRFSEGSFARSFLLLIHKYYILLTNINLSISQLFYFKQSTF